MPAREWAHASPFTASSAEALDALHSPRYCKYNVTWIAFAGKTGSLCWDAHIFHLRNAPTYVSTSLMWKGLYCAALWLEELQPASSTPGFAGLLVTATPLCPGHLREKKRK